MVCLARKKGGMDEKNVGGVFLGRVGNVTKSWLEYVGVFAILACMNGFRVTILVLLCLAVGLMFYAVAVLLPARQDQYELYQTQQKIQEYQQRDEAHRARMAQLQPEVDAPEVANARQAVESAAREQEMKLTEAEEQSVIASAKRKQQISAARKEAKAAAQDAAAVTALGTVAAFSKEWNSILFTLKGNQPVAEGLFVAVRRDGDYIVCEAVVDGRDEESGQVSATIKQAKFGGADLGIAQPEPVPGDEVIVSPYLNAGDLKSFGGFDAVPAGVPAAAPQGAPAGESADMPELEATLTPIP